MFRRKGGTLLADGKYSLLAFLTLHLVHKDLVFGNSWQDHALAEAVLLSDVNFVDCVVEGDPQAVACDATDFAGLRDCLLAAQTKCQNDESVLTFQALASPAILNPCAQTGGALANPDSSSSSILYNLLSEIDLAASAAEVPFFHRERFQYFFEKFETGSTTRCGAFQLSFHSLDAADCDADGVGDPLPAAVDPRSTLVTLALDTTRSSHSGSSLHSGSQSTRKTGLKASKGLRLIADNCLLLEPLPPAKPLLLLSVQSPVWSQAVRGLESAFFVPCLIVLLTASSFVFTQV